MSKYRHSSNKQYIKDVLGRTICNAIGEGVSILNAELMVLAQNSIHKRQFGDRLGEYCYRAYAGRDSVCPGCPVKLSLQDGKVHKSEKIIPLDGRTRYFEVTASPLKDSAGEIVAGVEVIRDITERKLAEKELLESENRYRSLVESTDDSIYLVDRNYRYLFMNRKHLYRLGLLGSQFVEQPYGRFHSARETKVFKEKADKVFASGKSMQFEYRSTRDGYYFLQTFSPVKDQDGNIIAITVVSKEITERRKIEEKLRTLSFTDSMTGLYNRRGFFAMATQQLKLANRDRKKRFLISADLDGLKTINDTYGHQEGDHALIEVAIILKENFRESDIIARIGGDEFVILAIETPESDVDLLVARIKSSLDLHNVQAKKPYELSLSIGMSSYDPESPVSIDDLLSGADRLMYEEKKLKKKA